MNHGHTKESLIAFEDRVAAAFEAKRVRGPIHLCSDGQAEPLLDIFKGIRPQDWCLGTWRSHWLCLLKGVPEEELFQAICEGRSMFLCFKEQRIICSAIVGGTTPIADGIALGIKMQTKRMVKDAIAQGYFDDQLLAANPPTVHCFVGDMCAEGGLFHEATKFAFGHDLPVKFYVEDNGLSTNANTGDTWGRNSPWESKVANYRYERTRPHTGTGKFVTFG